jgi:hypothetical protein
MPDQESQPTRPAPSPATQLTQPKGIDPKTGERYEPIEIPVPGREEIEDLLSRAAQPVKPSESER